MQLVILAAGMGSRYGGLKQLDTFGPGNNVLMEFSIFDALRSGFNEVLFIIRKDIELDFQRFIDKHFNKDLKYDFAFQDISDVPSNFQVPNERIKPWGTAHALYCARNKIKGDFLIVNADDFYGSNSYKIAYDFLKSSKTDSGLVSYDLLKTLSENGYVSRGVCSMDSQYGLLKINERKKIQRNDKGEVVYIENEKEYPLDENSRVSMNMFAFKHNILQHLDKYIVDFFKNHANKEGSESYLTEFLSLLIEAKKINLKVLNSSEKWSGVTYKEDKDEVNGFIDKLFKDGVYPKPLWD